MRPYSFALIAALAAFSGACSKHTDIDDDDERDADAGAGSGGTAGRGGRGGSGGTAGTPTAPVVRCGNTECPAPLNLLSALGIPGPVACCLSGAPNQCGIAAMAGATCESPAKPDARCSGIDLSALGMFGGAAAPSGEVGGCCIDNACGLDGALFGRGCVENGEAKTMLSVIPVVGSFIMVPAPRACDAPPPPMDAGADDAGL